MPKERGIEVPHSHSSLFLGVVFGRRGEEQAASATMCWRCRSNREIRAREALRRKAPSCANAVRAESGAEDRRVVGIGRWGSLSAAEVASRRSYLQKTKACSQP